MEPVTFNNLQLKKRSDLHLARKAWHISCVAIVIFIYVRSPQYVVENILLSIWLSCIAIELLRFKYKKFNLKVISLIAPIMRQEEIHKISGLTYMLAGITLIYLLFPSEIITLSLLFLCLADPIASYVGVRFGKKKIFRNKTLEGFLGALSICFITSWIYFDITKVIVNHTLLASLLAGLTGALAELIPVGKLDDNLTLPIISAILLSGVFYFFSGGGFY